MPDLPLEFREKQLTTEQNDRFWSCRPFVTVELGCLRPLCLIDTTAPFSIVSFSVAQHTKWTAMGQQLKLNGKPISLDWQGVPCQLGETEIYLIGQPKGTGRLGPFRLVGKFAQGPHPAFENHIILGMNFLADNNIALTIYGRSGPGIIGWLCLPDLA